MTKQNSKLSLDLSQKSQEFSNEPSKPSNILRMWNAVALLLVGAGVGWLMGLSISPVVHIVITSLMAAAAAVIGVLGGVNIFATKSEESSSGSDVNEATKKISDHGQKVDRTITPWPLALLVLGITIGSACGIWVRTHKVLGVDESKFPIDIGVSDLEKEVQKWETFGISRTVTVDRLFNYVYNGSINTKVKDSGLAIESPAPKVTSGGLTANLTNECILLRSMLAKDGITVQRALELSAVDRWQILVIISDTVRLLDLVDKDICPNSRSSPD